MSQQTFDAFRARLAADETLREELSRALGSNGTAAELTAFAKQRGYDFAADEVKRAVEELSDDELDAVAGGTAKLMQACTNGTHFKEAVIVTR